MQKPKQPNNEEQRLKELKRLQILDSEREKDFDNLVSLAAAVCGVPISLITLLDESRQWFKAKVGLEAESTSREISFCGHAINQEDVFFIEDALSDDRFVDNPLVTDDPKIRFYAGMPLKSANGMNLGTLCVIDSEPKKLNGQQIEALKILGRQASRLIDLRDKKNQLTKKNEQLENINGLHNQINNIISHDVRGPIRSLKSYLNSGLIGQSEELSLEVVFPIIKQGINNLNDLIENLLEWSANINTVTISTFRLFDLVIEIAHLFEETSKEKNISFKFDFDSNLKITADISMIKFVVRNLVSNALKFTENGEITISGQKIEGHGIRIAIADTGIGIKPTSLEKIKSGKKNISTIGTKNEKGTGLGIKLIKEFLRLHQSSLNIKSVENNGSTFSFTLPLSFS